MIDKLKFEIKLNEPIDFYSYDNRPVEFLGFSFKPVYGNNNEAKHYQYKKGNQGIVLKLFSERLQFVCSIHKLHNIINDKRGNHNDFNHLNVIETINWLEKKLKCDSKSMIIRNIEVGVNLKLVFPINNYLKQVKAFQNKKPFLPMRYGMLNYGKYCQISQYKVKLYDKHLESKVHQQISTSNNLLRYELVYNKMQPLKKILYSVEDLKDKKVFESLGEILKQKFNQITFSNHSVDASVLTTIDRQLYYAGMNPLYWLDEKINNPKGHHNIKAKRRRIKENLEFEATKNYSNLINELEESLKNKIAELR